MSNIANIAGALIALAAVNRLTKDNALPGRAPAPLIPTALGNGGPVVKPVTRPTTYATRAKPITPFKTVQQRAEEAAFIARQQKMTREELIGKGPSGYLSL